ncbi:OadG family protein [bacterium]|nr:OadG family protein [bacterium]
MDRIADAQGWAITLAGILTVFLTLVVIWVFIEAFGRVMRHLHLLRQPEDLSLDLPSMAPMPAEPDDWVTKKSPGDPKPLVRNEPPPSAVAPKPGPWSALTHRLSTRNNPARSIFRPRK